MSEIIHSPFGTTFSGPDGVALYSAITLRSAIRLWANARIRPARGWTITKALSQVTVLTGQRYRTSPAELQRAYDDLTVWIETMRSAIPTTTQQ